MGHSGSGSDDLDGHVQMEEQKTDSVGEAAGPKEYCFTIRGTCLSVPGQ